MDEILIMDISYQIRSKPDWKRKYKDVALMAKWKAEVSESPDVKTELLDQVFDYVFKELRWYELTEEVLGNWVLGYDDKIVTSDSCVPENLRQKLVIESQELKDSFLTLDYHPRSDNAVVDLVHPSLYQVVYGKTKSAAGKVLLKRDRYKFQWLPAVVEREGAKFKFRSYINNLHPIKFESLYSTIEDVLNLAIPGINWCLRRELSDNYVRIPITYPFYSEGYKEAEEDLFREVFPPQSNYDVYEKREEEFEKRVELLRLKYFRELVPNYVNDPETVEFDLLQMDRFQVIVKMANIELTPESPRYHGGSWHVEATYEEDIVATVLYYYDVENITSSKLSFRTDFEDPPYDQHDSTYVKKLFGLRNEDIMLRSMGSVECKQGRVLVFPNTFHHHVDEFELADKTKPGFRKILCFFIINPFNVKVVGSDKVAPQQLSWWDDGAAKKYFPQMEKDDATLLNEEEVLVYRELLMDERVDATARQGMELYLCEH